MWSKCVKNKQLFCRRWNGWMVVHRSLSSSQSCVFEVVYLRMCNWNCVFEVHKNFTFDHTRCIYSNTLIKALNLQSVCVQLEQLDSCRNSAWTFVRQTTEACCAAGRRQCPLLWKCVRPNSKTPLWLHGFEYIRQRRLQAVLCMFQLRVGGSQRRWDLQSCRQTQITHDDKMQSLRADHHRFYTAEQKSQLLRLQTRRRLNLQSNDPFFTTQSHHQRNITAR